MQPEQIAASLQAQLQQLQAQPPTPQTQAQMQAIQQQLSQLTGPKVPIPWVGAQTPATPAPLPAEPNIIKRILGSIF